MAQDKPELFTNELAKNAQKGAWYEGIGALIGLGIGSGVASGRNLKGWDFFSKATDYAFIGWAFGLIGRLWSERSNNQASALQLDSKMIGLQHENKWLKTKVVELGGQLPEQSVNHGERIIAERNAPADNAVCLPKN